MVLRHCYEGETDQIAKPWRTFNMSVDHENDDKVGWQINGWIYPRYARCGSNI